METYNFYFYPEHEDNKRLTAMAHQLRDILPEGYNDGEHPDTLRLAVWIDRNDSWTKLTQEAALEWARNEQEQFAGDYDNQADAAESIHSEYFIDSSDENLRNLVIDWEKTWDYSFAYDFDGVTYSKRKEADPADTFPMPTFDGAGFWTWRSN
jgi:hypothetical protein